MSPLRTANMSGVVPPLDAHGCRRRLSISVCTTGACPSAAAHISAVCPFQVSLALMSAPASSSTFTASTLAGARRKHQRRLSGTHDAVRIGAGLQQLLDDVGVAVLGGERQRRDAVVVCAFTLAPARISSAVVSASSR